jgi:hypothetical protein
MDDKSTTEMRRIQVIGKRNLGGVSHESQNWEARLLEANLGIRTLKHNFWGETTEDVLVGKRKTVIV